MDESELFASLVADAKRREPPPEALRGLLETLGARSAVAAPATAIRQKWMRVAIAGAGGVALLGAVTAELSSRRAPAPGAPPAIAAPAVEDVSPSPAIPVTAPEPVSAAPAIPIADLPDAKVTAPRGRLRAPAPAPSARREIELVAQAREALTRGDARACLAAVDLHDREFPAGQFALEASVMRIEATLASGDRAAARALALEYLAKHPGSPYEGRVRSLVAASTEER
ncbi:MAG: outer membrane protein assembly factor BamD [Labilithrix sp.]|nr:outer membrane protein assembly factor BamD [Labilithrix sp.]